MVNSGVIKNFISKKLIYKKEFFIYAKKDLYDLIIINKNLLQIFIIYIISFFFNYLIIFIIGKI